MRYLVNVRSTLIAARKTEVCLLTTEAYIHVTVQSMTICDNLFHLYDGSYSSKLKKKNQRKTMFLVSEEDGVMILL